VPGLGDAEQHELWLSEEVLLQRRKNQLEGQLRISPHEFLALAGCRSRSGALLTYYSSSSMLAKIRRRFQKSKDTFLRFPQQFFVFFLFSLGPVIITSPVDLSFLEKGRVHLLS